MEKSVGSTIEKIKLQEQDNEAKLKEKRELDATIASLERGIRDATMQAAKAKQESLELIERTDKLWGRLELNKLRNEALRKQYDACTEELNALRCQSDKGMSEVWHLRSTLSDAVQNTSDECDIRALLAKPIPTDTPALSTSIQDEPEIKLVNEDLLKEALEKRNQARAEKIRLAAEPENGEEFLRIKNALKYSLDMIENLRKRQQ